MRRSLTYYWRINLAVTLAAAVATAVLTGALLVGDSVKGSLRDLTLNRLGEIDHLMVSQKFLREDLVKDIASNENFSVEFAAAAPAIFLNGTAVHAKTKARASQINVLGLDQRLIEFYPKSQDISAHLRKPDGQLFPSVVINASLQQEIGASPGDQIVLSFQKPTDIASGSLLGDKDTEDLVESVRLTLTAVIPDDGLGRFSLRPNQALPKNAYVILPVLQKALEQPKSINVIAVSQLQSPERFDASQKLQAILKTELAFEDLGLTLDEVGEVFVLGSKQSLLSPQVVALATDVAQDLKLSLLPSYTYLANKMIAHGRTLPYSTVASLDLPIPAPYKPLRLISGAPAPALGHDEILVNAWAARDLRVKPGDNISMTYFGVGSRDELITRETEFTVKGVLAMSGLAVDSHLTPDFPGISEADNMADWDPPFEVDLSLIRKKDEDYWDAYKGMPKAFVSLVTGQELWGSRFGKVTTIRLASRKANSSTDTRQAIVASLLARMEPTQFDLAFQPVKLQGLLSSKGATDFGGLFISFSQFLIVSAALLVGLLFRLSVEQRAKEIGMLLAVGYQAKKIRRQLLKEGTVLAVLGALVGLAGAVFYAWFLMVGLRTWWVAAIGSPFLFLHVEPVSLLIGYVISILVVLFAIWLGFRKLSKIPASALLAGQTSLAGSTRSRRRAKWVGLFSLIGAVALSGISFTLDTEAATELFFGVGTLLLIAGLAFFSTWLRGKHKSMSSGHGTMTFLRMAARNSPRNPGRSMLSAALVGCACFTIVAVESFRHTFGEEVRQTNSGAGGFALMAQADVPLLRDLSSTEGRLALGFSDADSDVLSQSTILPFRFLPGDDASCLNLYQVQKPRILGVPQAQIERGGFTFQQLAGGEDRAGPWAQLSQDLGPQIIPAFGDYNSVIWILHSGLGKDLVLTDELGQEIRLRFVGLFKKSIFQSEVLISENQFLRHFPSQSGYAYYLIAPPPGQVAANAGILEKTLADYGFDSEKTADKLADYQAVENTYLSTFQALGGLGLLLGTLGLGMILIRNVMERRGELATLRAFGFKRATLATLVVAENGFLLAVGVLIGGIAALISVAPHIITQPEKIPWPSMLGTLAIVFLVGMLASIAAVSTALRIPLLPALRAE